MQTLKAIIDEQGNVKLLEPVNLSQKRQALVTILEESVAETSLISFLDKLVSVPTSKRSPGEIEADIQAERNTWK